jgi:hypothetical protein
VKPKTILTAVILAFVAVSVVYLIVKETRPVGEAGTVREGGSDVVGTEAGEPGGETAETGTAAPPTAPVADRTVIVTYYYDTGKR